MLKLNHAERGILIAALTEARSQWNHFANSELSQGNTAKAAKLRNDAARARDLCTRFEEEQS